MPTKEEIIKKIDGFIEKLSMPLTPDEMRNGWDEENQRFFIDFFKKVKGEVEAGISVEYVGSIGRGMDSRGIVEGDLLDEACGISVGLKALK